MAMLESDAGFSVNALLQCAGIGAACPRPPGAGCAAIMVSAAVIVALGVERDFKPSQDGSWNNAAATTRPRTDVMKPPFINVGSTLGIASVHRLRRPPYCPRVPQLSEK